MNFIKKLYKWKLNMMMKAWSWLSGKKTALGVLGMFLTLGAEGMGWLPPEVAAWAKRGFAALSGVGVMHKAAKRELF